MLQNTNEIWTVFKKETFRTFIVLKSEDNPYTSTGLLFLHVSFLLQSHQRM